MTQLSSVNERLKDMSGINKKATDQFSEFSKQREQLTERKKDLDRGDASIRELITWLGMFVCKFGPTLCYGFLTANKHIVWCADMKKDEAIMRTFKQVAKNFKEVFSELVPRGSGSLKLVTDMEDADASHGDDSDALGDDGADSNDDEEEEDEEEEDPLAGFHKRKSGSKKTPAKKAKRRSVAKTVHPDPISVAVDRYRGMSVHVSFGEAGAESQNINQLSGGQKSLVALAIIFAIQRADPAPFYVFDEVDSALDSIHRAAVANMLRRQSHVGKDAAQFICTTFRPEIVTTADKWFLVNLSHKVSGMEESTKQEALSFISALMEEEAKGGLTHDDARSVSSGTTGGTSNAESHGKLSSYKALTSPAVSSNPSTPAFSSGGTRPAKKQRQLPVEDD
jgi:structural maintenance of chromosome 3 (chondroitin sulfate proteoglycan 6)